MKFSVEPIRSAQDAVTNTMAKTLQNGQQVLWLVSGGSCIASQVAIMDSLRGIASDTLKRLTIVPIDERFGVKGHDDSNTEHMRKAGFDPGEATWYDILENNNPLPATLAAFVKKVEDAGATSQSIVATLGIGPDGHTAGILPGSPAVTDTTSTAVGFSWSDYERITMGVSALLNIDSAFVFAYGESKKQALERLLVNEEPFEELPAKLLYDLPDVTVYNDFIESEG